MFVNTYLVEKIFLTFAFTNQVDRIEWAKTSVSFLREDTIII